jgi:GNAT superfamily N-acetyltransferase
MDYTITEIDWNNIDEVEYWRRDIFWEEVFSLEHLKINKDKKLPFVFFAKDDKWEIIWKIIIAICDEENEEFFVHSESRNNPWLFWVFVNEEYRKKWIWKELVNRSIEYSKKCWFKYLFLDASSASKFYEKNWNFKYYHTVKNRINPKINEIEHLNLYFLEL